MSIGMEIERKYLVKRLNEEQIGMLDKVALFKITQNYLKIVTDYVERRVRKKEIISLVEVEPAPTKTIYYYTEKSGTGLVREEKEEEITEEQYLALLEEKDPNFAEINKLRYVFKYEDQTFELDLYPFFEDECILEIELESEDTPVILPPFLELIKEVTFEKDYKNKKLAEKIALLFDEEERRERMLLGY